LMSERKVEPICRKLVKVNSPKTKRFLAQYLSFKDWILGTIYAKVLKGHLWNNRWEMTSQQIPARIYETKYPRCDK
jgi:hypothetical protein